MNNFKIISYYTKSTGYESEIMNLISSIDKLIRQGSDIDYYIEGVKNLGDWSLNTRYKAIFVKEMLDKFDCPLVFTDADSIICEYPILFDTLDCDISVYYREEYKTMLSGTFYIEKNERTYKLVNEWIHLNNINSKLEQKNLEEAINKGRADYGLKYKNLPPQYVQIFDTMKDVGNPVIKHMQASRKYKKSLKI